MTINQKIKKLETLKAIFKELDKREMQFRENIEYYEKQLTEVTANEDDYRVTEIEESRDAIKAIEILRKELEKLA